MIKNDDEFTIEEKEAIEELRKRTGHMVTTPRLLTDQTLFYRFLKARGFNIDNAEEMFKKHISARKKFGLEDICRIYLKREPCYKYIPVSILGCDKEGAPVIYVDCGRSDFRGITTFYEYNQVLLFIISAFENGIDKLTEQSKKRGKSLTQLTIIINLDQFTLYALSCKKAVEWILNGFKFYQDNYPERCKAIIVINASSLLSIWLPLVKMCLVDSLVQKMKVYNKNDWQNVLLELMDADVLPAFLGGNKTDPDGNPLCSSFVGRGEKIPADLLQQTQNRKSLCQKKDVKKANISRFSCFEIELYVEELNAQIEWEFETKAKNIAFGLYYKQNTKDGSEVMYVIPKEKYDTSAASVTGYYICDQTGTYVLVFDNSYSWFYAKELYYRIRLIGPDEPQIETK